MKKPFGLLLIHGFSATPRNVAMVGDAVKHLDLPTRAPTLRGHGAESPEALRGVTWKDWLADGKAALEELLLEADKVIILGHSMGGLVTANLAAEYPDKVAGIILAAPYVIGTNPLTPFNPLNFLAPVVTNLLKQFPMPPAYFTEKAMAEDTNYGWVPTDALGSLFAFSKVTAKILPQVKAPAVILQSKVDPTTAPRTAQFVYDRLGTPEDKKQIIWFEESSHEMFLDNEQEAVVGAAAATIEKWVNAD